MQHPDRSRFSFLHADISAFLQFSNDIPEAERFDEEAVSEDVMTVIDRIIQNTISQNESPLTRKKSLEIVGFLNDKGIFLVKGAIEKVAELLGISKVTVYSYLDEIRKAKKTNQDFR